MSNYINYITQDKPDLLPSPKSCSPKFCEILQIIIPDKKHCRNLQQNIAVYDLKTKKRTHKRLL